MLQQHGSLRTIKKKLIRKALDMIRKIAEEDPDENNDKDKKGLWFHFFQFFICIFGYFDLQSLIRSTQSILSNYITCIRYILSDHIICIILCCILTIPTQIILVN